MHHTSEVPFHHCANGGQHYGSIFTKGPANVLEHAGEIVTRRKTRHRPDKERPPEVFIGPAPPLSKFKFE